MSRMIPPLKWYVLDEHHQVKAATMDAWGEFFRDDKRIVAQTKFDCGVFVSTVFLGIDHRFGDRGPPLLFETMIFEMTMEGGGGDMWRYSSWDDAETGHAATVRRVKAQLKKANVSEVCHEVQKEC